MTTAPSSAAPAPVSPQRILEMSWSFAATRVLTTALELEIFRHVAQGKGTPDAIAKAAGTNPRATRILCDALVGLGLLARDTAEGPLRNPPDVDLFLVPGKPSYVGEFVVFHSKVIDEHWRGLTEIVRTGRPHVAVDRPEEGQALWHQLVDALFPVGFAAAKVVGQELARRHPGRAVRLLDVAAGSGVWGLGAATANPSIRVTALDLPGTLEHTRRFVERTGLASRVDYLAGDLRDLDFGERRFEAATLGHICHSEGEGGSKRLFEKLARALVPGGTIVIADFVPDANRRGPLVPLLFGVNMLVNTSEGDVFTFPQYAAWLSEAGFSDVGSLEAPAPSPLIVATRR